MVEEKKPAVSTSIVDGIARIVIDWPPVNVLSRAVRVGLADAVASASADGSVEAMVISCAGRSFIAGGDITEFGKPAGGPDVNDILPAIEDAPKPVVAAMHGNVLGGGLEVALACHGRVCAPGTKFGMPEVTLGLIPGAGGTIRLPRVVGLKLALDMIVSGAPISADKALEAGLVDEISPDIAEAATALARRLASTGEPLRRTRTLGVTPVSVEERSAIIASARTEAQKRYSWSEARRRAIDSVANGLSMPFDDALKSEREAFEACVASEEAAALFHVFFAERKVASPPGLPKSVVARDVASSAVIGSGTMGRGIAIVLARAGLPVKLIDTSDNALAAAGEFLDDYFSREVEKGRSSADKAQQTRDLIQPSTDLAAVATADLVIEAVFEERAAKRDLFARLDAMAKPGAILATNTSSLDVLDIAHATKRPADVVGMHFFSPAQVMPLLEIVQTSETADDVARRAMQLAGRLRKTGVLVGNCFGFVANRMIFEYQRQAEFLVEEGSTPEAVDRVLKAPGMPMGPFEMFDMAGLDVGWRIRKDRAALRDTAKRYSVLNDLVCEAGWYGQKTKKGWYDYGETARDRRSNPDLAPLIEEARRQAGIAPREISDGEIRDRCLLALVNEGAKILEEGIAQRAADIDVIYVAGFGYPRYRGGPMFEADRQGLGALLEKIRQFEARDPGWWKPADVLVSLVEKGRSFADFDAAKGGSA